MLAIFAALLATFAAVTQQRPQIQSPTSSTSTSIAAHDKAFDYVIVGGGTAGLAIAARLAEGSTETVAVVEAGGFYEQDNGNLSVVPGYCAVFAGTDPHDFNPLVDWGLVTEPQKDADNRRLHYPRGKTLGGSSARNFMFYHRPTIGALDKWAEEVGDDSYSFKNLLPYYQKAVHYTPPILPFTNSTCDQDPNAWNSDGGPLQVSHGNYIDPFGTWAQPAVEKLGIKAINGFSSGQLIGSGYIPYTVDPGRMHRSSSESSYLQYVQYKPNLQIYNNTLAEKILVNGENRATGVVVSSGGSPFTLQAKKEVILSAGAFQSPQLLMLSGIGPADTLEKYNISVHVKLPGVGQNLIDHPLFGSDFRVGVPTVSASLNNPALQLLASQAYQLHAAGPLTIPTTGLIAWEKLPAHLRDGMTAGSRQALDAASPTDWPELEHIPVNVAAGYQRNYLKEDPVDGFNYATVTTSLVAPLSRGTVSIASSRVVDLPLIDPNFLAHPADVELAVAAVRRQREIWAAMSAITIGDEYLPGPNVTSDKDILEFIKQSLAPTWHAASTCKMGKKEDPMAVVDSEGRVFGTEGLRVVDASVFPFLPPGHPQATVYALAEKIAELILKG